MVESSVQVMHPSILFPWFLAMLFEIFFGGATPGLTATMATALIVAISYDMPPLAGLAVIICATFAAICAGEILATFIRIPGTPASSAATLDGYQLTLQGKGVYELTLDLFGLSMSGVVSRILQLSCNAVIAIVSMLSVAPMVAAQTCCKES